jgi:hypothetical protein
VLRRRAPGRAEESTRVPVERSVVPAGEPALRRAITVGGLAFETLDEVTAEVNGLNEDDDFDWAWKEEGWDDAVFDEIVAALFKSGGEWSTTEQFLNEIRLRFHLIAAMNEIHAAGVNIDYNHHEDYLTLPTDSWQGFRNVYDGDGNPALDDKYKHVAQAQVGFHSTGKPSKAVADLFADKDEKYFLECNTATVAMHYQALLKTVGADTFDARFGSGLTLMPEWLYEKDSEGGELQDAPSLTLIPDVDPDKIKAVTDLIPGDWVYFANYPDYAAQHPGGPFAGENALYLGKGKYRGFGVAEFTYDGMIDYLRKQYNQGLPKKKQKAARATNTKADATLREEGDGPYGLTPGIQQDSVRRIMQNPQVQQDLENRPPQQVQQNPEIQPQAAEIQPP